MGIQKSSAVLYAVNTEWSFKGDGYLRLPLHALSHTEFAHYFSEIENDLIHDWPELADENVLAGHSEWLGRLSCCPHEITLGWDWYISHSDVHPVITPDEVRSNLMLVDSYGHDLGQSDTSQQLMKWLEIHYELWEFYVFNIMSKH